MFLSSLAWGLSLVSSVSADILMNGQVKVTNYPDTKVEFKAAPYSTYDANAPEISYKGRWDSKKVSFWA
jgi:hypothetical protein